MKAKHEICTMQILIIAATEQEIQPYITANTTADVLIAGVGVPATMYHLQKRIQQVAYDIIIQAGIAGGFSNKITLGQTVLVKQDCFADIGFEDKEVYSPIFKTEFSNKGELPSEDGWLLNRHPYLLNSEWETVKAITVNKVSDSKLQQQQYMKAFDAGIESMEGAALHYVCLQENIPFLQLRSISNYIGERDKTKWLMKEAVENLNAALAKLINRLTN